jgi:hypothetical protein
VVRNGVRHWGADWIYLEAEVCVHDLHMATVEAASQRSSCIAWSCPALVVVVVEADNCATTPRRLAAYEVQNLVANK